MHFIQMAAILILQGVRHFYFFSAKNDNVFETLSYDFVTHFVTLKTMKNTPKNNVAFNKSFSTYSYMYQVKVHVCQSNQDNSSPKQAPSVQPKATHPKFRTTRYHSRQLALNIKTCNSPSSTMAASRGFTLFFLSMKTTQNLQLRYVKIT